MKIILKIVETNTNNIKIIRNKMNSNHNSNAM